MKKIKDFLSKISLNMKTIFKEFPVTMVVIIFTTIFATIISDMSFSGKTQEIIEKILIFSITWGFGTFFSETYFKKKSFKFISFLLTGIMSFVIAQLPYMENVFKNDFEIRFTATYVIILGLITVYKSIKNSGVTFKEYILDVFKSVFHSTIIYAVLNIGIMLVLEMFVELLLNGNNWSVFEKALILILGLYYVPSWIFNISNKKKIETSGFIKGLILYVLLPLVTIAMAIIYLYMAKIIILRDIPKNTIFRILAILFMFAFPIWNLAQNFGEEKKIVKKISNFMPYLYIPFIFLEIYAIGKRIINVGVTPLRYMACVYIIFQIILLFLTWYKKGEKLPEAFIIISVLVFVILLTPLNYDKVSNWSQLQILNKTLENKISFKQMSKEEQRLALSAYNYLKSNDKDKINIPKNIEDEMKNADPYDYRNDDYTRYVYVIKVLDADISNYNKIVEFPLDSYDKNDKEIEEKVKEYSKQIIEQNEIKETKAEQFFEENNLINIDENRDYYISSLSVEYNSEQNIEYYNAMGYLLEK